MTPDEEDRFKRARRGRNIALALGLVLFVILIFVVTIIRLGGNVVTLPF